MWWLDTQTESVARKRTRYNMVMIHRIRCEPETIFCLSDLF